MSGQREVEPARSGEIDCSYCGSGVPDGSFCGACGAHLAHGRYRGAATRAHAHAAFPDEGVLRLGVVSSLFPRLPGAARGAYRVAFGLLAGVLAAVAAAGLQAPVIAVSALAIPLLFLIYVYETGPRDRRFAVATAAVFAAGAALGVTWALEFGPVVSGALIPAPGSSLTSGDALVSAVAVPVLGQLLMLLPAAAARLATPGRSEALEGFTAGVVSALGVTMAATLTELAPLLRYGNLIQDSSVLANLTQAVIRGVSVPLVAAAATGYISAALWKGQGAGSAAGGRWLTHPALAVAVALAVETGLGYADDAGLPDAVLLTVHLVAAAAALLALRIGLHHVLLHEGQCAGQGVARECPNCGRTGPAMPFCPGCGVTERASGHMAGRRLGHRRVLGALAGGLALLTAALVVVALEVPSAPPKPCTALNCLTPFALPPHPPRVYTSRDGWSVQWYPASAVFPEGPPATSASPSASQLRLDFTNPGAPAEDGELAFTGGPAQGHSADEIVTSLQQANAPNAVPDYVMPGASLGYTPGYGEAFQVTPSSADGNPVRFEVTIICAIRDGYAICAYAVGPQVSLGHLVTHPTEARLALALWADPDLNGVRWKGQRLP
jgi:RsiW-degrading membrane proteinase PrsW (M82 family)